jgi:acyl-CoA thioesterase-2
MSQDAASLLRFLTPEKLEVNIFRAHSYDIGSGRVFGGFVLGQALYACTRTVETDWLAHSLHAYFILPGKAGTPIVYDVDRTRDGRSFTTRHVVAIQNGQKIFSMSVSFHKHEDGLSHQAEMPDVPPPEALENHVEFLESLAQNTDAEAARYLRSMASRPWPVEFRPVDPMNPLSPQPGPPVRYMWIRFKSRLPDIPLVHQCILAGVSDYGFLGTSLLPHGVSFWHGIRMAASLDHAMWFHRPFRVDEWLLYAMDSPTAFGARSFNRGMLFTRSGTLVASVTQEGLIRT